MFFTWYVFRNNIRYRIRILLCLGLVSFKTFYVLELIYYACIFSGIAFIICNVIQFLNWCNMVWEISLNSRHHQIFCFDPRSDVAHELVLGRIHIAWATFLLQSIAKVSSHERATITSSGHSADHSMCLDNCHHHRDPRADLQRLLELHLNLILTISLTVGLNMVQSNSLHASQSSYCFHICFSNSSARFIISLKRSFFMLHEAIPSLLISENLRLLSWELVYLLNWWLG